MNETAAAIQEAVHKRAEGLLTLLSLEAVERNLFLGQNEARATGRLFGGQVLAQAAMAASSTVEEVQLHSLHAYFLRAGSPERPVLYEVERIRDGRSFVTRRVVAIQAGAAILSLDASFQIEEPGFEHSHPMPNVPMPEELQDDWLVARALAEDAAHVHLLSPMAREPRPFQARSVFAPGSDEWAMARFREPHLVAFSSRVGRPRPCFAGVQALPARLRLRSRSRGRGQSAAPGAHCPSGLADGQSRPRFVGASARRARRVVVVCETDHRREWCARARARRLF